MNRLQIIAIGVLHFLLIAAAQIFIFNNIRFLGYINPMIYVWFILMLPYKTPYWALLLLSFAMGLCIDVFTFGQGFHTATLTFIGFLRPFILKFYTGNRDITVWQRPTSSDMGFMQFTFYITILIFIHHLLFFTLDILRFTELIPFIIRLILSSVTTIIVIIICDLLFMKHKKD
ncbi:MAG: hypothetical protein LBL74_00795 [Bacteroidales bacterium]|jgi:hypothetical protein|nr:hypothetical protein [Bacteroidales bacterium]